MISDRIKCPTLCSADCWKLSCSSISLCSKWWCAISYRIVSVLKTQALKPLWPPLY